MKKYCSLLLVLCLIFLLPACGKGDSAAETETGHFCVECGGEISATDKFCSSCGAPIAQADSTETTKDSVAQSTGKENTDAVEDPDITSEPTEEMRPEIAYPTTPQHTHSFSSATCEYASQCYCGAQNGKPLGHDWENATCEKARTCKTCGKKDGKSLGHDWEDATCEKAYICKTCGVSEGNPNGHYWTAATLLTPKTCEACEKTEGDALSAAGVYKAEPTYSGGSKIMRTIYLNEDGSYKFYATGQEAWIGTWKQEGITIYVEYVSHPGTIYETHETGTLRLLDNGFMTGTMYYEKIA